MEVPSDRVDWANYRALCTRRLAWSILALHGESGRLKDVHQSFVTKELFGTDDVPAGMPMPRGIGTLWLAAQLLQASGGEMTLNGLTPGHDVRWWPALGGTALIEIKDRAWQAGWDDSPFERARYVANQLGIAGPAVPRESAARIVAVMFHGYISPAKADVFRQEFHGHLEQLIPSRLQQEDAPDAVIVEVTGVDGSYAPTCLSFFADFDLGRPEWIKVRPSFSRAFTANGVSDSPEPWPIHRR